MDETPPSQAQVDELVRFVGEMLDRGKAVLVHRQGGCGRTGTMLACCPVSQGWEAEEALAEVRNRRPASIVSKVQQTCVVEYVERLQRGGRL